VNASAEDKVKPRAKNKVKPRADDMSGLDIGAMIEPQILAILIYGQSALIDPE